MQPDPVQPEPVQPEPAEAVLTQPGQAETRQTENGQAENRQAEPAAEVQPTAQPRVHATVQPPREPTEVVITQADPAQPKRGGWWSRAKATLSGQ